jgi:DNA-binding PadR family transcriptional regulator
MDVRTICLGILIRGDATGYEIKKLFDGDGYKHFVEASFGSIYPALQRLTAEGLVSVRAEIQEKRPDRKVYSITDEGRTVFLQSLMEPLAEDKHRSPFVFAMLFSNLLPHPRVVEMIDTYIQHGEAKLAQLLAPDCGAMTDGERFVKGLGRTVYIAMLNFLRDHRAEIEGQAAQAAE